MYIYTYKKKLRLKARRVKMIGLTRHGMTHIWEYRGRQLPFVAFIE